MQTTFKTHLNAFLFCKQFDTILEQSAHHFMIFFLYFIT